LGYAKLQPRSSSPLGIFSTFDGNVTGGSLLGIGMALSGTCPGSVLTQTALGIRSGFFALGGAIVGGIVWTGLLAPRIKKHNDEADVQPEMSTLPTRLGLSKNATLAVFEAGAVASVVGTALYTPRHYGGLVSGVVGGLLLASAQLLSILTRRSMLGISGSYEEVGKLFWWGVAGADPASRPRGYQNILFAAGIVAGSLGLSRFACFAPSSLTRGSSWIEVSPELATVGGVLMIVGSRLAGGCTSGHGISGMSLLSTSSVITMASAFAAGGLVAPLFH
jgi:uncharacterized membrane protein YedE/YeeE